METGLRLLIVLAGLPEPTVNLIMRGEDGSWRMQFDLCYLDQRLIVEYDGRQHRDDPEQWQRDIYRREDLDRMDYRLLIVTRRGIYKEPHRTLERVRDGQTTRREWSTAPDVQLRQLATLYRRIALLPNAPPTGGWRLRQLR
jgi:hypothetical protein